MKSRFLQAPFAICLLLLTSCGSVQKMATHVTSDMLVKASPEMETEESWDVFKDSMPSSLKFLEGLLYLEKNHQGLLYALTKGHAAYAFGVGESLHLEGSLQGKEDEHFKGMTLSHYSKAMKFGLQYLNSFQVTLENLLERQQDIEGLVKFLDAKLNDKKETVETVFFLGQAWVGSINLQKNRPQLVSQLPLAKGLFDWACKKDPNIQYGGCDLFYASYEASRPVMLGGNPEKGKELFLSAIGKYPHNLMFRATFIQYYLIPLQDGEGYQEQKKVLEKAYEEHRKNQQWVPGEETSSQGPHNLMNSMALKRFEVFRKLEKDLF